MSNHNIVPAFRDYVLDPTLKSAALDIAEIGLDTFTNGIAQELPGVKILFGLGKSIIAVRDRNFQKQTMKFFVHLHDGSITSEQFEKYKKALEEDKKRADKELSRVIILLDRITDDDKTEILASFYRAYIVNLISWERFFELSEALDRMFLPDIELIIRIAKEYQVLYEEGGYLADRLASVGLVQNPISRILIPVIGGAPPFGKIPLTLTSLGKQFVSLYFSSDIA